ncbi:MAG: dienelactone hydrolase [Candidatus Latescibacterota bacterium]|jgi:dienelactone hydrolase
MSKGTGASPVSRALNQRLLGRTNFEDPKRCELHRFILSRLDRFQCPDRSGEWKQMASGLRRRFLNEVYLKGHSREVIQAQPEVVWGDVIEAGRGYRIRKLRYEGYPGMWIPALLYEPEQMDGKVPGVLNPNGHHSGGKAMDYKQARCINLAKRGMLALNTEFIGMGELTASRDHNRIGHLDLSGKAGVGVFYLAMKRALDVLVNHPSCDPGRVAMTGLSGGGWQTAVLSALDERVKVIVPVAGHSPLWQRVSCMSDIGDLEQVPSDLCQVADFDTMTALFTPRPTLLIYNFRDDCCFRSRRTRKSVYAPVKPLYESLGIGDHFEFYENRNPGTHNYEADSRGQLYRFLNKHFGLDTPEVDLPFEDELLSESQLNVGLPQDNATLISLANDAMLGLRKPTMPKNNREKWILKIREQLKQVIRLPEFRAQDEIVSTRSGIVQHRVNLSQTWTLPVTEFVGDGDTVLMLADGGRQSRSVHVNPLQKEGHRVLAADVFGTGESKTPAGMQMVLAGAGERPLGVLVGQVLALSRWAGGRKRISVSANGMLTSFAVLCAAALEPKRFSHLYLNGALDSLKRLIDQPVAYHDAVPLFCFGLLQVVDVPDLLAMTEGLAIEIVGRGPIQPV